MIEGEWTKYVKRKKGQCLAEHVGTKSIISINVVMVANMAALEIDLEKEDPAFFAWLDEFNHEYYVVNLYWKVKGDRDE
jgi:hypothetical protein